MLIRKRIVIYAVVMACLVGAWLNSSAYFRPPVYSVPSGKVQAYLAKPGAYRVVFIGDSRTFTDIQPRVVGPLIGRPTYNMATFGLWMPVQYLEFQEVFPHVPQDTVLVWSLSHHNFAPIGDRWWIPGQYKFGLLDAAEYLMDGYPPERILREYEESPFSPVDLVVKKRRELTAQFDDAVWKHSEPPQAAAAAPAASTPPANIEAARLMDELKQDKNITYIAPASKDGIVNSIEVVRSDGGYDRIVVDPAYFKNQQSKLFPQRSGGSTNCTFVANDVYMRTFYKILDLVAKYRLRLVVNYIEDAPGNWQSDAERQCAKQFMVDKIVPILTSRGIAFMGPDLYPRIGFSNDYYFDESHLATEGASIYSKMFATDLKNLLTNRGW